jgi:hypothetical protein
MLSAIGGERQRALVLKMVQLVLAAAALSELVT